jgi:phosphohistidine phosphatase
MNFLRLRIVRRAVNEVRVERGGLFMTPRTPGGTVELYLVKHADAAGVAPGAAPDESRGITAKGRADADAIGRYLAGIGLTPDAIIASPRTRAAQTAELIAQHLGVAVRSEPRLLGDCGPAALDAMLADAGDPARAILVGHIYAFAPLILELSGDTAEPLRDGAVARIAAHRPLAAPATLRWLQALGAPTGPSSADDREP